MFVNIYEWKDLNFYTDKNSFIVSATNLETAIEKLTKEYEKFYKNLNPEQLNKINNGKYKLKSLGEFKTLLQNSNPNIIRLDEFCKIDDWLLTWKIKETTSNIHPVNFNQIMPSPVGISSYPTNFEFKDPPHKFDNESTINSSFLNQPFCQLVPNPNQPFYNSSFNQPIRNSNQLFNNSFFNPTIPNSNQPFNPIIPNSMFNPTIPNSNQPFNNNSLFNPIISNSMFSPTISNSNQPYNNSFFNQTIPISNHAIGNSMFNPIIPNSNQLFNNSFFNPTIPNSNQPFYNATCFSHTMPNLNQQIQNSSTLNPFNFGPTQSIADNTSSTGLFNFDAFESTIINNHTSNDHESIKKSNDNLSIFDEF